MKNNTGFTALFFLQTIGPEVDLDLYSDHRYLCINIIENWKYRKTSLYSFH